MFKTLIPHTYTDTLVCKTMVVAKKLIWQNATKLYHSCTVNDHCATLYEYTVDSSNSFLGSKRECTTS